jgi:hypothetical protein
MPVNKPRDGPNRGRSAARFAGSDQEKDISMRNANDSVSKFA